MRRNGGGEKARTIELAERFLEDTRAELAKVTGQGYDLPPRVRTAHTRVGHATPEFRTLAVPLPDCSAAAAPDAISEMIARYAAKDPPSRLFLAFVAETRLPDSSVPTPVLVMEVRDAWGTRLYQMLPFFAQGTRFAWSEPIHDGWQDPGEQEMILDAAFEQQPEVAGPTRS